MRFIVISALSTGNYSNGQSRGERPCCQG